MADQVLQLEVRLENGQLKVATKESQEEIKDFAKETEKAGKKSKSAFAGIADGVNIAKAAVAGFLALGFQRPRLCSFPAWWKIPNSSSPSVPPRRM